MANMKSQKLANMIHIFEVNVDDSVVSVTISDERETLLAAKAAGRVVVGYQETLEADIWLPVEHLLIGTCNPSQEFLERIARRQLGKPWRIAESSRLKIREFVKEDANFMLEELDGKQSEALFLSEDRLSDYINNQYRQWEYGIWAVIEKETDTLIGKVGFSNIITWNQVDYFDLGYHVFSPFRKKGYAKEACSMILQYGKNYWDIPICAVIAHENQSSARVVQALGFQLVTEKYIQGDQYKCLYVLN